MLSHWERDALYDYFHAVDLGIPPTQWLTPQQIHWVVGYLRYQLRRMCTAMFTVFPYTERAFIGFCYRHNTTPVAMQSAFIIHMIMRRTHTVNVVMKASDGLTRLRYEIYEYMRRVNEIDDNMWNNSPPWLNEGIDVSEDDEG